MPCARKTTLTKSLNPLKRVNSILTIQFPFRTIKSFNTVSIPSNGSIQFLPMFVQLTKKEVGNGLNPLKRVNSILTSIRRISQWRKKTSLNPLKRVNSILTWKEGTIILDCDIVSIPSNGSIQFLPPATGHPDCIRNGLNPLKRVNSILTW